MAGGVNLGSAHGTITLDASGAKKGSQEAIGAIEEIGSVGTKLGKVLGGAMAAAGIAITGALAAVTVSGVRMAADLEAQMSGVQAVMGNTAEEIGMLEDLILDLGVDPNLKVSSLEAAEAIEMLGRNGLDTQEILDGAARATVLLANATDAQFGTAADIATDTMALFNIEAADMMSVVDGITGVVNNSKFSIDDYALALAQGGGVASQVGVELEDFNTVIAAISPAFNSGSDAGTSFKTMLQRMAAPTDKAIGQMEELGLWTEESGNAFFDANGNLKDMRDVAGILQGSLADLTEEQRTQALTTLFGADAIRAASALAEVGAEEFDKLAEALGSTDAAEAARKRMDNLRGALEILDGVVETIKLRIGNALLPVLTDLAREVTLFLEENADRFVAFFDAGARFIEEFVEQLRDGEQPLFAFLMGLEAIGVESEALNTIREVGETIGNTIDAVSEFVDKHSEELKGALAGIAAVIVASKLVALIGAVGTALATAGAVIAGLLTPLNLLIGLGALLGAAWAGNWFGMRDKLQEAWEGIRPHLEAIRSWLEEKIPQAAEAIRTKVAEAWSILQEKVIEAGEKIQPHLESVRSWMEEKLPQAAEELRNRAGAAIDGAKEKIRELLGIGELSGLQTQFAQLAIAAEGDLNTLSEQVSAVAGDIRENIGNLFTGEEINFDDLWKGLVAMDVPVEVASGIRDTLTDVFSAAGEELSDIDFGAIWDNIVEGVQSIPGRVQEAFGEIRGFLEDIGFFDAWQGAFDAIKETLGEIGDFGGEQLTKISDWFGENQGLIEEYVSLVGDNFVGAFEGIGKVVGILGALSAGFATVAGVLIRELFRAWSFIGPLLGGLVDILLGVVTGMMQIAVGDWAGLWETIKETAAKVWEALKEAGAGFVDWVTGWFGSTGEELAATWAGIWENVKTTFSLVWEGIKETASNVWDGIKTTVTDAASGVAEGISNFVDGVRERWSSFWDGVRTQATEIWTGIKTAVSDGVMGIQEGIANFVAGVRERWNSFWEGVRAKAAEIWAGIKAAIRGNLESLFAAMGLDLDEFSARWAQIWEDVKLIAQTVWERIKTAVANETTELKEAIATKVQEIRDSLAETWEGIRSTLQGLWNQLVTIATLVWERIKTAVANKVQEVKDDVTSRIQETRDTLEGLWGQVRSIAEMVWERIRSAVASKVAELKAAAETRIAEARDTLGGIWDEIKGKVDEIWGNIVTAVSEKAEEVKSTADEKISEAKNTLGNIWDEVKGKVDEIWGAIVGAISEKGQEVVDEASGAVEDAREEIEGMVEDWIQAGKDLVQGLIDGVLAMAGDLIGAVTGLAEDATGGLLNFLEEDSPSKLYYRIGADMIQGLINAILDMAGDVEQALASMLDFSRVFSGLGDTAAGRLEDELDKAFGDPLAQIDERMEHLRMRLEEGLGIDLPADEAADILKDIPLRANSRLDLIRADFLEMQEERNELEAEYAAQLEKINELQEAQADLDFLQQQLDLLNLLGEHGLDAQEVLGDIQLGVGADPAAIVEAMTTALQAVGEQVNDRIRGVMGNVPLPSTSMAAFGPQTTGTGSAAFPSSSPPPGGTLVQIFGGVHLEGVEDADGFVEELLGFA